MQRIGQIKESLKITQSTANPETFFSRREFAHKRIVELYALEQQYPQYKSAVDSAESFYSAFQKSGVEALTRCYSEYVSKAYGELKSEAAIQRRKDKFWEIAGKHLQNAEEIRESLKENHFWA